MLSTPQAEITTLLLYVTGDEDGTPSEWCPRLCHEIRLHGKRPARTAPAGEPRRLLL